MVGSGTAWVERTWLLHCVTIKIIAVLIMMTTKMMMMITHNIQGYLCVLFFFKTLQKPGDLCLIPFFRQSVGLLRNLPKLIKLKDGRELDFKPRSV